MTKYGIPQMRSTRHVSAVGFTARNPFDLDLAGVQG
jgi:hypothetical protein